MFSRTRRVLALSTALVLAILAGCADGGDSQDEMTVTITVDGVAKGSLHAGDSITLEVPSGAEVVMQSNVTSTWTAMDPEGAMTTHRSEPQYHSDSLWSPIGAEAVMKVANGAAPNETVTVVFQVDRAEFQAVPARVGDAYSTQVVLEYNGNQTLEMSETVTDVADDGSREETSKLDHYGERKTYFDAEGREVKFYVEASGLTCNYTPAYAQVSYPLFVGKSWSSDTYFDGCYGDTAMYDLTETRTVEAFERISTQAGDFDTLRVRAEGSFKIYDFEERDATQVDTCWWSVTLGRFIRCETDTTYLDEPDKVYRKTRVLTDFHLAERANR